jgi:primosomal protein N'
MNLPIGSKVRILFGSHAGKCGFVVGIPSAMEAPDYFYAVMIRDEGVQKVVTVPDGSLTLESTFRKAVAWLAFVVAFVVAVIVLEVGRG